MKHYKIQDGKLIMSDASRLVLMIPYISTALSGTSMLLILMSQMPLQFDFLTILMVIVLAISIVVLIWALIKKTFQSDLTIREIDMLKQSKINRSGFYLQLKNGKQHDLAEIKHLNKALELSKLLRSYNPKIVLNFSEHRLETR